MAPPSAPPRPSLFPFCRERGAGPSCGGGPGLAAEARQAINLGGIGDFGNRPSRRRRRKPTAACRRSAANAPAGGRPAGAAEHLEDFGGNGRLPAATRGETPRPIARNSASTSIKLPAKVRNDGPTSRFFSGSERFAGLRSFKPAKKTARFRRFPRCPLDAVWAGSTAGHAVRSINAIVHVADRMDLFRFVICRVLLPAARCRESRR